MVAHKVVSHDQWLAARKKHLAKEREFTHLRDQLSRERRELPWELVDKGYTFEGETGKVYLQDMLDSQIYHTYSTYTRGIDMLNVAYHYMDLVPKGRDEGPKTQAGWLRRRDEYSDSWCTLRCFPPSD